MQTTKALRTNKKCILGALCILLALCGWLSATNRAIAHALLVRSLPAANAELASAPAQIELWFSEPLESVISRAWLVDAAGNELADNSSTVDATDPTHMVLRLPELAPGIYTVVYRTLSQADGHEWLGSFPLMLLNADGSRPAGAPKVTAPAADVLDSRALPTPLETLSRWLSLMGALLTFGAASFGLIAAVAPIQKSASLPPTAFNRTITRCLKFGIFAGVCALIIGGGLQIAAFKVALGSSTWRDLLLGTRAGNLLIMRTVLAAALGLAAWFTWSGPNDARQPTVAWFPKSPTWQLGVHNLSLIHIVLGMAILTTFSIGSHAAAVAGRNWAILSDLIHLTAAAIWMGGLLLLAALLWQMRHNSPEDDLAALRQTVQRFSTIAMLAVFVLIGSGLFSSIVQLPTLDLLWSSAYGWVLIVKVGLVFLALGVAFLNRRLVHGANAIDKAADNAARNATAWTQNSYGQFLRQVWSESAIGLVVMVVAAVLVQTPVPQPAASDPGYFETTLSADDLTVHMQITPNQIGDNQYVMHLYHDDNSSIGDVQMVRLSFVHQTAELGQATLELADRGSGLFTAEGTYQNHAGPWDVSVYVRRRGMDDALTTITVDVPTPGGSSASIANADPWQNPMRAVAPALLPTGIIIFALLFQFLWFVQNE